MEAPNHHDPYMPMPMADENMRIQSMPPPPQFASPEQEPAVPSNYYQSYNEKALPMLPPMPPQYSYPFQQEGALAPQDPPMPPPPPPEQFAPAAAPAGTMFQRKRPLFMLLLVVAALVLATAIAVGVGVGVSERNKLHDSQANAVQPTSSSSLPSSSTTVPTASTSATSSSAPAATSATASSSSGGSSSSNNSSCPGAADTEFTLPEGQKYLLICGHDYSGTGEAKDIGNVSTSSMFECMEACANVTGCAGAGWGYLSGDTGDTHSCWMKSQLNVSHAAVSTWNFGLMLPGSDE